MSPSTELRLLIVVPTAVPGGMEEIVFNLAACLPDVGVRPEVVSLQSGPLVDRLRAAGIVVEVLEAGRLRDLRRMRRVAQRIGQTIADGRFDAVFADMPKAHIYTALAARRRRTPALWCQAGQPDPPHWIDRLASALPADGVIALSRAAAAAQRRLRPRCPVQMLHPGIDVSRFVVGREPELRRANRIGQDAPLVSLVGRLQPWKGQREFLRAAALVLTAHPDAHFAIVGGAILGWEGDYPAELERMAATLGIADRVIFTGHTDAVPAWMRASDVVVNASAPEPFGLVVVEAMASGCAVVAVNTGGPRDIIEDGRSGLLCDSREPEALAGAVSRLLGDPQLRSEIASAARSRVETEFSRERMAEVFADLVRQTVAATNPATARRRRLYIRESSSSST